MEDFTRYIMLMSRDHKSLKRRVKVDTGASVDVVDKSVVKERGLDIQNYSGPGLVPFTSQTSIMPIGQVEISWHGVGKPKTYTNTFLVVDMDEADCILGHATSSKIGLLSFNHEILHLGLATP